MKQTRSMLMAESQSIMDKNAFTVTTFAQAEEDDRRYWHSCTPEQRIAAMEQMRRINYDYDPVSDRIQRVVEIVE